MARRSPGPGAHVHPDRIVRARKRLVIAIGGFKACQRAAAHYGARMAALGRYKREIAMGTDAGKIAEAFEADMLLSMRAEARLARARDEALRAGLGRAVIEELLRS